MKTSSQRVAIVQDLKDLSVRLAGPGAMTRIAEINESDDLKCFATYLMEVGGMTQRDALSCAWREMKLETQPV